MSISRIDTLEIDQALENRKKLIETIIKHQAAPTVRPGWLRSYWPTLFMIPSAGLFASLSISSATWPLPVKIFFAVLCASVPALVALIGGAERESRRALIGPHLERWTRFQKDVEKHLTAVEDFNYEADALSNADVVLDQPLREKLETSLAAEKERILAAGKDLFRAGFDEPFAPCLAEIIDQGGFREAADARTIKRYVQLSLLAERLDDAGDAEAAKRLRNIQQPIHRMLLATAEPDDIEARFSALDAADRSKPL